MSLSLSIIYIYIDRYNKFSFSYLYGTILYNFRYSRTNNKRSVKRCVIKNKQQKILLSLNLDSDLDRSINIFKSLSKFNNKFR